MGPEQAVGQAMEGADPHTAGGAFQQLLDAYPHFIGGLVGEGHCQDALWGDPLHLNEPGDAVDKHAGLAAAGASQDQQVPWIRCHCLALVVVEGVEYVGYIHGGEFYTISWQILCKAPVNCYFGSIQSPGILLPLKSVALCHCFFVRA